MKKEWKRKIKVKMCIICRFRSGEEKVDTTITVLDCSGCKNLTTIPELSELVNLEWVTLDGCTNLTSLPDLSGLVNLSGIYCKGCTSLTSLPDLSGLVNLLGIYCQGCTSLTSLKDLSGLVNLQWLDCTGCTSLTSLPDLSGLVSLEELCCSGCKSLTSLPDLSGLMLEWLDTSNCPWLSRRNPKFNGNVQKLVLIQRNLRKLSFRRRLNKRYYLKKFLYTDLVKMVLTF